MAEDPVKFDGPSPERILINSLLDLLNKRQISEAISFEIGKCVKNYLKRQHYVAHIDPKNFGFIVNVALDTRFEKV